MVEMLLIRERRVLVAVLLLLLLLRLLVLVLIDRCRHLASLHVLLLMTIVAVIIAMSVIIGMLLLLALQSPADDLAGVEHPRWKRQEHLLR
jgi:hypothetical protein